MAALPILTRDQRNGTVFVEDKRSDGTVVVLSCAENGKGGGVAAKSQDPDTVWPMLEGTRRLAEETEPIFATDFVLRLDTSALPAGRLDFEIGPFVEQAQQAAEMGAEVIHLDEKVASKWGLKLNRKKRHFFGA